MIIELDFAFFKRCISVPNKVGRNMNRLQREFFVWIETADHPYWVYENGEKYGLQYEADAFLDFINNHRYKRSVAKLVQNLDKIKKVKKKLRF